MPSPITETTTQTATESINALGSCITCEYLQAYTDLTNSFATKLAEALQTPMWLIFGSLAMLWIVVVAYEIILNMKSPLKFIDEFFYIIIASVLLGGQGVSLIETVFYTALDIMTAASSVAFEVVNGKLDDTSGYTGLVLLMSSAENAIVKVFLVAANMIRSGNLLGKTLNTIYAIILCLPYTLLLIAYSAQIVVAIFRLMMLAILAPFLFLAFAFNWGRNMAKTGVKTLLSAILVLFASTAAVAVTMYGVVQIGPVSGDQLAKINEFASITNPKFLVIIFLGWAGSALLAEGTSIANSIAGTALTNVATGIMTAGGMTSVGFVAGATGVPKLAGKVTGAISGARDGAASWAAGKIGAGGKWAGGKVGAGLSSAGQAVAERYFKTKSSPAPTTK